jgi:hypothetical protein
MYINFQIRALIGIINNIDDFINKFGWQYIGSKLIMCFITLLNLVSETEQIFLFQSARVLVASVIRTLLRRLKFTQIQKWDLNERLIIVICRHFRLCLISVPLLTSRILQNLHVTWEYMYIESCCLRLAGKLQAITYGFFLISFTIL